MKLSVVTSLYNSAPYIEEFYRRIKATLEHLGFDHEIIMVNDGSPDRSLEAAICLAEKDSTVVVVDLSRNFGHHKALITGMQLATGDLLFLIDVDLEEDPELLSVFFEEWQRFQGTVDVIYGVQKEREGGWFRKFAGLAFYRIFNLLSKEKIPVNLGMTRLMSKRYVENFLRFEEKEVVLSGLFQLTGFAQKPVTIIKKYKGSTSYSLARRFVMFLDSIASFSQLPLIIIWWLGLVITVFSGLYSLLLIYEKLINHVGVAGWVGIMVSIWFMGGITLFAVGVVGLYVSKIFLETKRRPLTIIRKIYRKRESNLADVR